jgi:hypothetical protein
MRLLIATDARCATLCDRSWAVYMRSLCVASQVAVFAERITPATTFLSRTAHVSSAVADASETPISPTAFASTIAALLTVLALAAAATLHARRRDRSERSADVQPPPKWLRAPPAGWTFIALCMHHFRLYHLAARICHVVPGHVAYTRTINTQLLLLSLLLNAVGVVLFVGGGLSAAPTRARCRRAAVPLCCCAAVLLCCCAAVLLCRCAAALLCCCAAALPRV